MGDTWKKKNLQFSISQKWFEILALIFHKLLAFMGTRFVENLKALDALDLDFPPKKLKTSYGCGRRIFWATPFKFGENSFLPDL